MTRHGSIIARFASSPVGLYITQPRGVFESAKNHPLAHFSSVSARDVSRNLSKVTFGDCHARVQRHIARGSAFSYLPSVDGCCGGGAK